MIVPIVTVRRWAGWDTQMHDLIASDAPLLFDDEDTLKAMKLLRQSPCAHQIDGERAFFVQQYGDLTEKWPGQRSWR